MVRDVRKDIWDLVDALIKQFNGEFAKINRQLAMDKTLTITKETRNNSIMDTINRRGDNEYVHETRGVAFGAWRTAQVRIEEGRAVHARK